MRRVRLVLLLAALGIGTLLSCVDGGDPVGPDLGLPSASLAILPELPPGAQAVQAAPVNLIRLTVLRVPGEEVVAQSVTSVDPSASEWDVQVEVPLDDDPGVQYLVEIELVNETGGVQTVQWSGRAGPLTLSGGTVPEIRVVEVSRGPLDNLDVTGLTLEGPASVPEQADFMVTALVETSDPDAEPTVYWTSLDPGIATVDEDGQGQALVPGLARIQAEVGELTAVHEVQVTPVPSAVVVEPEAVELGEVGQVAELTATVLDLSGEPIPGAGIDWTVANDLIVEDLGDGRFRATGAGETTVTATSTDDPTLSASATVTVTLEAAQVVVTPGSSTLTRVGQTVGLAARVLDAEGNPILGLPTSWSTSNATVATVNAAGLVTAVADGTATITAVVEGLSGTATVTVDIAIHTLTVSPSSATLAAGDQLGLTAVARGANGNVVPVTFAWSSSDPLVATVEAGGVVTGNEAGTATITASAKGASGSAMVTVEGSSTGGEPGEPVGSTYQTVGNTELVAGDHAQPPGAHVYDPHGVLAETPDLVVASTGMIETELGGTVYMESDGSFSYRPPVGSLLTDSFEFTVEGGGSATVQIQFTGGTIWYVDGSADGGNGLSNNPLSGPNSPIGAPGDLIFVYSSTVSSGFELLDGQRLVGEGVGLFVDPFGLLVPAGTSPVVTTSSAGVVLADDNYVGGIDFVETDDGIFGNGVVDGEIESVRIVDSDYDGVTLLDASGTFSFTDLAIDGAANRGFVVDGGDASVTVDLAGPVGIQGADDYVVLVQNTVGGLVRFQGGDVVAAGGGGVLVQDAVGTVDVLSFLDVDDPTTPGIEIRNSSGSVSFADIDLVTDGQYGIETTSNTGPVVFTGRVETTGSSGWNAQSTGGLSGPLDADFTEFIATNVPGGPNRGRGFFMARNPGTVQIGLLQITTDTDIGAGLDILHCGGGELIVTDPASFIVNSGGDAFGVTPAPGNCAAPGTFTLDVTLGLLESVQTAPGGGSGWAGAALGMGDADGVLTIAGGNIVEAGTGIRVGPGTLDLTYDGAVLNTTTGTPVSIADKDGGTVSLGGSITSTDQGITIQNNAAGTSVVFSGGLDLQTSTNDAFTASNGGTVEVTGAGNRLETTTGLAILIQDATIGAGGVTFESISSDGALVPVGLDNTGATGAFAVTGSGAPGSGGTIQNTTGAGISLTQTGEVTLGSLSLTNTGGTAVAAQNVADLVLDGLQITNVQAAGIVVNQSPGPITIRNTSVDGTGGPSRVESNGGTTTLEVDGSSFLNAASGPGGLGYGLDLVTNGGDLDALITGSSFQGNDFMGLRVDGGGGSLDIEVAQSSFSSTGSEAAIYLRSQVGTAPVSALIHDGTTIDQGNRGVQAAVAADGSVALEVNGASITNTASSSIWAYSVSGTTAAAVLDVRVVDTDIDASGLIGIEMDLDGSASSRVAAVGNVLTNITGGGIQLTGGTTPGADGNWDVTLLSNSVNASGLRGLDVTAGEDIDLCLNAAGNSSAGASVTPFWVSQGVAGANDVRVERLPGTDVTDPATVQAHLDGENPGAAGSLVQVQSGYDGVAHGSCVQPPSLSMVNTFPVAHPQTVVTDGSTPVVIDLTGTDIDGDGLTFSIVTPPSTGSLGPVTSTGPGSAQVTYTPAGDGDDPFTFQVSDGSAALSATVTVQNPTPMAQDAAYATAGNTRLVAGGATAPGEAHVADGANVFDPTPGLTAVNTGSQISAQGGEVLLNADGSFAYTPPAGFNGDDTFTVDAGDSQATVTVTVSEMVWYVDNTAGTGGDGTSTTPFDLLTDAGTAAGAGDIIFLDAGDETSTGHESGIDLPAGVMLYGEVAGLTVPGFGELVPPGGPRPLIDDETSSQAILLGGDNVVEGLEITTVEGGWILSASGIDLGTTTVDDIFTYGADGALRVESTTGGSITLTGMDVSNMSSYGVLVDGGAPDVDFDGQIVSGQGVAIRIQNTTGGTQNFTGGPYATVGGDAFTTSAAASTVLVEGLDVQAGTFRGVNIVGSDGSFTFTGLEIAGTDSIAFNVDGGSPTVDADVAPATITNALHHVIQVQNTLGGSVDFTGGPISDTGGRGIEILNTGGPVSVTNTTTIDPGSGWRGLNISGAGADVTFDDLTISSSGAEGLFVDNSAGATVTILSGEITAAEHRPISVTGTTLDVTLSQVSNLTSGGTPGGIHIADAAGSTVSVASIGLALANDIALSLSDAGSFTATTGTVQSTTGPAAVIDNTLLNVVLTGLTSESTDGDYSAVEITNSTGSFTATGGAITDPAGGSVDLASNNGLDFTYLGTITNSSGPAVYAASNVGVANTFRFGPINDTNQGIQLLANPGVTSRFEGDLDLSNYDYPSFIATGGNTVEIVGADNVMSSENSGALALTDLVAANTLDNVTATSNSSAAFTLSQTTGTATVDVTNGDFSFSAGPGIAATTSATGELTLNISGASIQENTGQPGITGSAVGTSTLVLNVSGNTVIDGGAGDHSTGITLANGGNATLGFDINGNQILNSSSDAIELVGLAPTVAGAGNLEGFVRNNVIDQYGSNGVYVEAGGSGIGTVEVSGNTLSSTDMGSFGITVRAGTGPGETTDLHVLAENNEVGVAQYGFGLDVQSHGTSALCTSLQGNNIDDVSTFGDAGIGIWQAESSTFSLERFAGDPSLNLDLETHLENENTIDAFGFGQGSAVVFPQPIVDPYTGVADGACRTPVAIIP